MECLAGFAPPLAAATMRPSLTCAFKKTKNGGLRAKLNDVDEDPLYQSALYRASLRFQETHLSEPLFVDAYAGCFLPSNIETDMKHRLHHYCLATKFIDDKLLSTMNNIDGVKQVVLLTDGMDTRPYRLSWPTSTLIFDISPESVFRRAAQKLDDVGAKIPRSCLLLHAPLETSNIQETLCSKGFSGNRPSIWAFQGLPVMTLANFEEILFIVSSLAMKGCLLLGEFPAWLTETKVGVKCSKEWMDRLFMSNGFRVDMIGYDEVARNLGKEPASGDYKNILFVAEHLRFSDNQMETWRREFQRVEEEGDEEGFEEL
ncbi:O-methyltransferase 1, chloroplastic isoform X1 [Cornus florida]|uniref:O-methyltransferase 1, chloroplastic isoform X1 n=1 Tax=Cornus florida TaxID=4283 RepID=UPI00289FD278|nr:O-methyltransferase 1, chloroplastic isoform X1 [Cornus florida]